MSILQPFWPDVPERTPDYTHNEDGSSDVLCMWFEEMICVYSSLYDQTRIVCGLVEVQDELTVRDGELSLSAEEREAYNNWKLNKIGNKILLGDDE